MTILKTIINLLEILVWVYFTFAAVYILLFAFFGLFPRNYKIQINPKIRKIAVLIPGYKEDTVIIEVAKDALYQDYPSDKFDIIVIADSFKPETLLKLNELPIKVIEVSFEQSTKSKALNKAMAVLGDNYDVALVLDADNLMQTDFLTKINLAFENGYKVVQGHRVAKNMNTSFAILDAVSEEINNHIFRKGHRNLGLSSALIGSAMAFDYAFFKQTMANVDAIGGFDKELELKLLRGKNKIEYLHNALVYDEKVQKPEVFAKQRKRWLSAQFVYFRRYFFSGLYHLLFKGNIDFFDKVYQMITPPRILLAGLVAIITILYGIINAVIPESDFLTLTFNKWLPVFLFVVAAFLFSIPVNFYSVKTLKALLMLPKAFIIMLLSLFKLKGANKKFIHTQHGTN